IAYTQVSGLSILLLSPRSCVLLSKCGVHLENLFVRPEHRRCGHGLALLRELARLCVARGYPRLEWEVLDWNESTLAFYHSIGAVDLKGWTKQRLAGGVLLSTTGQS
ncbi:MAG: GNAT family N-acetyltransferase, partial [Acidobacteria bacterium]|nr:GNAT family N-acetyltransferase [Acidobacteriota bacterium]